MFYYQKVGAAHSLLSVEYYLATQGFGQFELLLVHGLSLQEFLNA